MIRLTYIDLKGCVRTCQPAWNDPVHKAAGMTDAEFLARVYEKLRKRRGLSATHVIHEVEEADLKARLAEIEGTYFRYAGIPVDGKRDGLRGAWSLDADGLPVVDMAKARGVHMDRIRWTRNEELVRESGSAERPDPEAEKLFIPERKARLQVLRDIPQTLDLTTDTSKQLRAIWPTALPPEKKR